MTLYTKYDVQSCYYRFLELLVKLSVYHCLPLPTKYPLSLFNACEAWIIGPPVTVSGGGVDVR